ncbi:MAG: cupin domain-containing protein [Williamsia sp.]|nr:cupin domain-containing protein [Williamsia sp.]
MAQIKQTIQIGQIQLNFLLDGDDTGNSLVMFEFVIPEGAKVPVPHYHKEVDEVIYGLAGITSTTVDGKTIEIGAGDRMFIPKGAVHHHDNRHKETAKSLIILTPATIGPAYFKELSELIQPGLPPDPVKAKEIMLRHGLVPAQP